MQSSHNVRFNASPVGVQILFSPFRLTIAKGELIAQN